MDKTMYGRLLMNLVTLERIWNITELDTKRKELYKEARYITKHRQNL
jgi:hypothetical protein